MELNWGVWLTAGLLLAGMGAALAALEAVLWQTPRERMDQWPRSPRLQMLAADFAHPRDCLFTFLMLGSALARGAGWGALLMAALAIAKETGGRFRRGQGFFWFRWFCSR